MSPTDSAKQTPTDKRIKTDLNESQLQTEDKEVNTKEMKASVQEKEKLVVDGDNNQEMDSETSSSEDSDSEDEESDSSNDEKDKIDFENTAQSGKAIFDLVKLLRKDIQKLTTKCDATTDSVKQVKKDGALTAELTAKLAKKVLTLESENIELRVKTQDMKEKLLDLEFRQRRNNLVFDGIPEVRNETDYDCFQKILYVIRAIPGINVDAVRIDRCHRLGAMEISQGSRRPRPRAIIVCFNWFGDVTSILRNKQKLSNGVFVTEDFPTEWIDRRRVLRPLFQKLKNMEEYKTKTSLSRDKLIVSGKVYTAGPVSNINELNNILDLSSTCERRDDQTIAFHGIHSVFSNFHPAPFRQNGILFPTAEHSIQYYKADLFSDDLAKSRIMKTSSPYQVKKIGSRIKKFEKQKWDANSERIAFDAVKEKFVQNELLANMICETGSVDIVEASRELPWGTGVMLKHRDVLFRQSWNGNGLMCKILDRVRYDLVALKKAPPPAVEGQSAH